MIPDSVAKIEGTEAVTSPGAESRTLEVGPFDFPVELTGRIQLEEVVYRGLPFQKVDARLNLKHNKLNIERLVAEVAGGSLEHSAQVNLGVRGLNYGVQGNLLNVQANPIVKAFKPELAESIYGAIPVNSHLAGQERCRQRSRKN